MYAKIFSQIYESSIAEDYLTRLVFMDMLVLADKTGVVDITVEAMARRTNVPIDVIRKSLQVLTGPDRSSRSHEEDGRRLVALDGERAWGWRIVNFDAYNGMRDEEGRRAYMRNYMQKRRAKEKAGKQPSTPVNTRKQPLAPIDIDVPVDVDVDVEKIDTVNKKGLLPEPPEQPDAFERFWQVYPNKKAKVAARKAWNKAKKDLIFPDIETMLAIVEKHKASKGWRKDKGEFIPHPATWLNRGQWLDKLDVEEPPDPDAVNGF